MTSYVRVDLHKSQFTVHVRTEKTSEEISQIRQYATNEKGYGEFLKRVKAMSGRGGVKVAVESTGNTRFFKTKCEGAGAELIVINTMKFKVITESAKKTDKHDAATISEFLSKDMPPESHLCGQETFNMRRLLKARERLVRSIVGQKNEVHGLMLDLGLEDELRSLQSKKGRQKVLDVLVSRSDLVLEAQSARLMFTIIDQMSENVKAQWLLK